jgi:hypothetical protein
MLQINKKNQGQTTTMITTTKVFNWNAVYKGHGKNVHIWARLNQKSQ